MSLISIETFGDNLFPSACRKVSRVVEQLVDCVAFQVVAHFRANLTFDWLILSLSIALSTVLFELIQGGHDDSLADGAVMLRYRQRSVNMRDVTVVGLNFVERLVALLAFHGLNAALVGDVSFPASELHFAEKALVDPEAESIALRIFDYVVRCHDLIFVNALWQSFGFTFFSPVKHELNVDRR